MTEKGVAAVDRALSIVGALGDARRALTLSETAAATGLYKSTVLRLLASLARARFVARDSDGRYRLARASIGLLTPTSVPPHSRTKSHRCCSASSMRQAKVSASLCGRVMSGSACCASIRRTRCAIILPLVCLVRSNSAPVGACSNCLKTALRKPSPDDLAALPIVVLGKDVPDLAAMAVPIFGSGGRTLGAISVSGPLSRFDRRLVATAKPLLREIAITLTNRLGGHSAVFGWRR